MRYAAPPGVTEIYLSTGPHPVIDGFVEVPDDASPGDIGGMAVNGFHPAPEEPVTKKTKAAAPASDAATTEPDDPDSSGA